MSVISKLAMLGAAGGSTPDPEFGSYTASGFKKVSASYTINAPSNIEEGDLLILVVINDAYSSTNSFSSSSSGFTNFLNQSRFNSGGVQYHYKQASASDETIANYTVNWSWSTSGSPRQSAYMLCIKNMTYGGYASGFGSANAGSSTFTYTAPSFSAGGEGVNIASVFVGRYFAGNATFSNPSGYLATETTSYTYDYYASSVWHQVPSSGSPIPSISTTSNIEHTDWIFSNVRIFNSPA